MEATQTLRALAMDWFMPFTVKLKITYPNGLEHIIVNTMTPIDDRTSQMVQFCVRNDTEADTPSAEVIAFDRQVTLEDKRILRIDGLRCAAYPQRRTAHADRQAGDHGAQKDCGAVEGAWLGWVNSAS